MILRPQALSGCIWRSRKLTNVARGTTKHWERQGLTSAQSQQFWATSRGEGVQKAPPSSPRLKFLWLNRGLPCRMLRRARHGISQEISQRTGCMPGQCRGITDNRNRPGEGAALSHGTPLQVWLHQSIEWATWINGRWDKKATTLGVKYSEPTSLPSFCYFLLKQIIPSIARVLSCGWVVLQYSNNNSKQISIFSVQSQ